MQELISVIVPIYNVENYLKRCIISIIEQTYKNLEIILVDDGSLDSCGSICDEFAKSDNRIKVIHKKNGGLSDARNVGLLDATGNFVCFIDSDDYIEKDMIESLYLDIKKNDSDISCCGKVHEYEKNLININNKRDFCINNIKALAKMLLKDDIDNSACDKLFKRKLFNNIYFPVDKYYEDIATIYKTFIISNKVSHIKKIGYHYCIRTNSISNEEFSVKQLDSLYYSKKMVNEIISIYPELKNEGESFYYLELMTILRRIRNSKNFLEFKKQYKIIKKEFNKKILFILKNKYIPFYKKIMSLLIYFNLYKLVELIYEIITQKK